MRGKRFGRRAVLVALALALPAAAGGGARAATASADWVEQQLGAPALEDFNMHTVLYNGSRFPTTNGQTQRPLLKYLAYGTVEALNGTVLAAVARSDDGVHWEEEPDVLTVNGVPLGIDPATQLAVGYGRVATDPQDDFGDSGTIQTQFALMYVPVTSGSSAAATSDIHVALSLDGINFGFDRPLAGADLLPGYDASQGPTQMIVNDNPGDCSGAGYPLNCRLAITYEVTNSLQSAIFVAGSNDGVTFNDPNSLVTSVVAGVDRVAQGHLEPRSDPADPSDTDFHLYYAATAGTDTSLSVASSEAVNVLPYTPAGTNPIVPEALLESASPGQEFNLGNPVGLSIHDRFWYTRTDQTDPLEPKSDMFVGFRTEPPGSGPRVRVSSPLVGPHTLTERDIVVCASDTLGATPGVKPSSVELTLDGNPKTGFVVQDTLRCGLRNLAVEVRIPNGLSGLTDGDHILAAKATDWDGNATTVTVPFTFGTAVPDTIISLPGQSPQVDLPGSSIGTFEGETLDADSMVRGMRAVVRNPLGMSKTYQAKWVGAEISNPPEGFTFVKTEAVGKKLFWRWVAPTLDPHTAVPGPYQISFLGFDDNANIEKPDADNTVTILLV